MANTFVGVLRNRNFLKLWIGQVASQLAFNMVNFLIVLHIYEITKSSTSISLVLIASALPSVIFGSFSGVVADRLDYKKILVYTSFLRFFAVLLLLFSKNNVLGLLEIVFLISMISQFFQPAEASSLPLIIKKEKLVAANSVVISTVYITLLIGYSIAGPLMALLTSQGALLFAAALYLIATLSINNMERYDFKIIKRISLTNAAQVIENIWNQTKCGIYHIKESKKIYASLIKLSIGWIILGSFVVLLPGFAEKNMDLSASLVGPALIAPAGLGMLLGAYYLDKKNSFGFSKTANGGFIFAGISLLIFSFYSLYQNWLFALPLSILLMILMGTFCSIVYISSQTMLQLNTDKEMRGRIFGISSMLTNLAMSIPAILAGGISDLSSPFTVLVMLSLITIIYGTVSNIRESKKYNNHLGHVYG